MSFKTEITQEWLLGLTTALATMDDHDVRVRWQNMYKEQIFADVSFYVESASLSTRKNTYRNCPADDKTMEATVQTNQSHDRCNKIMYAHKALLCAASPVFHTMFTGSLAHTTMNPIVIKDSNPTAFHHFLEAMYTGEVYLNSYLAAIDMLYLAEKYFVDVKTKCQHYLLNNVVPQEDLLFSLERLNLINNEAIQHKLKEEWRNHNRELSLKSQDFEILQERTVHMIICDEEIQCDEKDIFDAVIRWGMAECQRRKITDCDDIALPMDSNDNVGQCDLRGVLNDLLENIRFIEMDYEFLCKHVYYTGIFTKDEFLSLIFKKSGITFPYSKMTLNWNLNPLRTWAVNTIVTRFQEKYNCSWGVSPGRVDYIDMIIDCDAKLCGITIFSHENLDFHLRIQETQTQTKLYDSVKKCSSDTTKIMFEGNQGIHLSSNIRYTIECECAQRFSIPYGKNALSMVATPFIKVRFINTNNQNGNGTTVRDGQFIAFHFQLDRLSRKF